MRSIARALAISALALTACRHAQTVGKPGEEAQGGKQEHGGRGKASTRIPPRPGHPAVAADPTSLMLPGSETKIQNALKEKGYLRSASGELDAPTSAAIRRFQRDQQLPETGAPDRETLRRLGVDPQDVYRTAPEPGRG